MDTSIYILTDGANSKIGISRNIDSRMQAYRTHNPTFSVYGIKNGLSSEVARARTPITLHFRDDKNRLRAVLFCLEG